MKRKREAQWKRKRERSGRAASDGGGTSGWRHETTAAGNGGATDQKSSSLNPIQTLPTTSLRDQKLLLLNLRRNPRLRRPRRLRFPRRHSLLSRSLRFEG
ncbi:hypothetical protein PIB30_010452 [Stylosanthes scabra]|uniref:Uncharacterized protein n=1 Tax=Stylosanthes scabra TaxID=79078 RepID=A0ABU6Y273_9FABA|nr:hypothetical protein [Stylosanthes scabra]